MKQLSFIVAIITVLLSCKSSKVPEQQEKEYLTANMAGKGPEVILYFQKGKEHNHPSFVLWAEDMDGKYIETLFITVSLGTGVFGHGDASSGKWMPGEISRPAAIPYWSHKRGIKAEDGLFMPSKNKPVPDIYTGATPSGNFEINTKFDEMPVQKFRILFEIKNQDKSVM